MFTTDLPQIFIFFFFFFGLISDFNIIGAALDPNNVENLLNGWQ